MNLFIYMMIRYNLVDARQRGIDACIGEEMLNHNALLVKITKEDKPGSIQRYIMEIIIGMTHSQAQDRWSIQKVNHILDSMPPIYISISTKRLFLAYDRYLI